MATKARIQIVAPYSVSDDELNDATGAIAYSIGDGSIDKTTWLRGKRGVTAWITLDPTMTIDDVIKGLLPELPMRWDVFKI